MATIASTETRQNALTHALDATGFDKTILLMTHDETPAVEKALGRRPAYPWGALASSTKYSKCETFCSLSASMAFASKVVNGVR